jgi:CPA2 family monovalent cation:H+ antiporter-2
LNQVGQSVELIEADYTRFTQVSNQGLPCIFGDATRDEILHAANLESAQSLIISVPNATVVRMIVHRVNAMHPGLPVVARATHHDDLTPLRKAGGDQLRIVLPEFEGGIEMARQALANCQHDPDEINHLVSEFRLRFQNGATA